ncbi:hypothetical protein Tco_0097362 [Tanacetum coccineum]
MFTEQSHDVVYGCLKRGSRNSGGKRLYISMVEEAWLSEKEELETASPIQRDVVTMKIKKASLDLTTLLDIGSPGVNRPPVMLEDPYAYVVAAFQAPPSPDYMSEPEYPPLLDFFLEPVYPEFMPPEDEEDDDEDPEEDPADYPVDGGDDGDDDDDEDDDVDIEGDEEEELLPTLQLLLYQLISIRDEPPTPFWSDTEVARLLAIPTPPPSPLSPWSSPLPQIPSPPLPLILSPLPVSSPPPASPTYPLGYRAAMIRLRAEAPSTSHSPPPHIILSHTRADTPPSGTPPLLPIPLPTSSPSLLLPSADHGADRPEVCLPPQKRLCFAFGPRYEVGESSSAAAARPTGGFRADYGFVATMDREIRRDLERDVGYGITDTWDEMLVDMPGAPATDDTELGRRMTEFTTRVRQDTDEIYTRLDDEQTERQLMAGRLNMLYRDRRAHARTTLLMEREARMSREAWGRSMDASDLARSEVMSLRTTVLGQQAVITELQAADRRRQTAITELLTADRRRQAQFIEALKLLKRLQTHMT